MKGVWLLVAALLLSACATSPTATSTIGMSLQDAELAATFADRTVPALLQAKTIAADQAMNVVVAAHTVHGAVVFARSLLDKGDAAGASAQLAAIANDIALLKGFNGAPK